MLACEARLFPQNIIPNAVTDIDGNSYNAVRIGEQVWLAENMRAKRDCEGNALYNYYPDNNPKNVAKYGYLYTWPEAKKVCFLCAVCEGLAVSVKKLRCPWCLGRTVSGM